GQAAAEGLQLGELLEQLLDYWRDLMVANSAGPNFPHLNLPPRYRETLARQASALKLDTILAGLEVLATTKLRLRGSSHTRVLLEMALERLSRLDDLVSLSQLAQMLGQPGSGNSHPKSATASSSQQALSRPANVVAPPEALKKKQLTENEGPVTPSPIPLNDENLA